MSSSRRAAELTVAEAREVLATLARRTGGVLDRREVLARGVPRWMLEAEIRHRRMRRSGRQTVIAHNGPLDPSTRRVVGVIEVGPRAALDAASSLQHQGVTGLDDVVVHVIAPKSSTPRHPSGVRVHESRRWSEADVMVVDGVRVVRPAVSAVHAALWARSDREAQLFPLLVVQQRRATVEQVRDAVEVVRRHPRRLLLRRLVAELGTGVQAMGELDVARALRRRGLPEPGRQVVRHRPSGRQYLDCHFEGYRLTMEVDGSQHHEPEYEVSDLLRDLSQVAEGDTVLRIPLRAWRLAEEQVLDRLEDVFVSRGWLRPAA